MASRRDTYHLDRVISRMWRVHDRVRQDENNRALWNEYIFIRRVVGHVLAATKRLAKLISV